MVAVFIMPLGIASAAIDPGNAPFAPVGFNGRDALLTLINNVLSFIWPLFVVFAIIMFIWAGILFLKAQGEPAELETARKALLWGVAGVIVGVLAFSIPFIILDTINPAPAPGEGGGDWVQP